MGLANTVVDSMPTITRFTIKDHKDNRDRMTENIITFHVKIIENEDDFEKSKDKEVKRVLQRQS